MIEPTKARRRGWAGMAVVLAGAALGWWMFGVRGLALFAAAGAAIAMAYRLLSAYAPGPAAAAALVLAAAALHSSSTLGWGGADAADGSRFKASPVGLSHVLTPHRLTSRTADCGWHAASGYPAPCAVARGGESAFRRLRAVYPMVLLAVVLYVAGAVASSARPGGRAGRTAGPRAAPPSPRWRGSGWERGERWGRCSFPPRCCCAWRCASRRARSEARAAEGRGGLQSAWPHGAGGGATGRVRSNSTRKRRSVPSRRSA